MLGIVFVPKGRLSSGVKESGFDEKILALQIFVVTSRPGWMLRSPVFSPGLRKHHMRLSRSLNSSLPL